MRAADLARLGKHIFLFVGCTRSFETPNTSLKNGDIRRADYVSLRFHGRRNTMIVFLYRPSPQVPEPSEQAAERCYDAGVRNVSMQSAQIANKSVDLTWIFTQSLFMALNTILWSLSYPSIRQQHPIEEVKIHLRTALRAINHTSERWPGVQSALQLYQNLIDGCLKAYSGDTSYVVRSPASAHDEASPSPGAPSHSLASPLPPSAAASYSSQSRIESYGESFLDPQHTICSSSDRTEYSPDPGDRQGSHHQNSAAHSQQQQEISHLAHSSFEHLSALPAQLNGHDPQSELPAADNYGMPDFDPDSIYNRFPSTIPGLPQWDPNVTMGSSQSEFTGYNDVAMDTKPWLGSFGDEYSRYMHQTYIPPQQQMQSLSEQQQLELMAALEQDQLPDVSKLVSDVAASYPENIL